MYFFWKTRLELHRPRKSEFKSEICTQYVDRFSQKGVVGVIWGWPNKRNIPKTNEFTNSTKVQNNSQPKVHQLDQLQQKINCQPKPQSPTVRPMCAITFTSLTLVVPPPRRTHGSRQVGSSGPAGGDPVQPVVGVVGWLHGQMDGSPVASQRSLGFNKDSLRTG